MNNEKARDFFSAYYEGSLEPGLKQSVEQRLKADSVLAADYAAFSATMKYLGEIPDASIEVPMSLSDRIATRIENNTPVVKGWRAWLTPMRGLAMAGVAAGVVGIAIIGLNSSRMNNAVSTASLIPTPTAPVVNSDQLNFKYIDDAVLLTYHPSTNRTVMVTSGTNGALIKKFDLRGNSLSSPLTNNLPQAALFCIQVEGESNRSLLAMPGSERIQDKDGNGTISEMALAIASKYHVPVLVQAANSSQAVSWSLSAMDARQAATQALAGSNYSVDQRPSGLLVIL